MNFTDFPDLPFDLERLLRAAVAHALSDENPETLLAWLRHELPQFSAPDFWQEAQPGMFEAITAQFQHLIWNALPLPGNGFSSRPLPLPGRNDPCLCGSGRKYKQCCASLPKFPSLDSSALWPLVLQQLPKQQLMQALMQHQVPLDGLIFGAMDMFDQERYAEAVELLSSLFAGSLKKPGPKLDLALQTLCDCYDQLGKRSEKLALLERITSELSASPLRAGAWQRLAALRMDENDTAAARQAFDKAMRDNPEDPPLSLLEVHLLGCEKKWDLARERAHFWLKRLQRPPYDQEDLEVIIAFLEQVVDDPEKALENLAEFAEDLDPESERLLDWILEIVERPLPTYHAIDEADLDEKGEKEGLPEQLRTMGLPEEEILRALSMVEEQKAGLAEKEENNNEEDLLEKDASLVLQTPEKLRSLEKQWHKVAGLEKPFGTADLPMSDWNGWEPEAADRWCAFLEKNPKAGDSLEIIDDLATAILLRPEDPDATLFYDGLLPLLQRAGAIVGQAVAKIEVPLLRWNRPVNRAALRSLVRLYHINHLELEDKEQSNRLAEILLTLNPSDNHGLRTIAMAEYLRHNQNEEAVRLARNYPNDILAETRYGLVLAHFRLNNAQSAQDAAEQAVSDMPMVAQYLVRNRVARPELSPHGITPGGEDQAWLYREDMREEWKKTRGALAWLGKIMKLKGVSR